MPNASESAGKRRYTTPQLTMHGTLEELTKGEKDWGPSDGWYFQGNPIATVS